MISQPLYLNVQINVPIWTETSMTELVMEDGKVVGAIVNREGKRVMIQASRGVILAAGGFARNEEMRKKYQASPITSNCTSAAPDDEGDAIVAAQKVGAATSLMDSAWWGASMVDPETGT
jgi:succinate dehydrogenase/fumarate reductase flavoprotein subunit